VANNTGSYTIPAAPGTYMPVAFGNNYLANLSASPVLALGSGITLSTNLTMTNATASISGSVVDANNSSIGLPGVLLSMQSKTSGLMGIGFTDTNGNFNIPVTAGTWGLKPLDSAVIVHGYLRWQNGTNVTAGATGVTLTVLEATALIYGRVTDNLGNPMAGVDVEAYDNDNLYESDGYTDTNGNYVVGVLGLGSSDPWQVQANSNNQLTNYVFSQPNGSTNINVGQAVFQDFTALLATNYITGNVQASGTNIVGVSVAASATINGASYNPYADTDANGNYSFNVCNGSWSVGVNCGGGSDSLDNILGPGNYVCPDNQTANITNNNAVVNFTVVAGPLQIITTSLPDGTNGIVYSQTIAAASGQPPYHWSLSPGSGSLPPGLSFTTNGVLAGSPTHSGTYNFSVRVTDSSSATADQPLSVTIDVVTLQVATTSLPDAALGVFYNQQLAAFGGQPGYEWSLSPGSGSLPPGLSLATNGVLSGTPASIGNFYFSVRVTDATAAMADQSLTLTVLASTNLPLTIVYSFSGGDGSNPNGLVQGSDGNFYGTTEYGGPGGGGTVFKITPLFMFTSLYSFSDITEFPFDGFCPAAGLVQGQDGNFYGTTEYGGEYFNQYGDSFGTVFKITTNGTFSSLYSFSGSDGANPVAQLVQGADGNLYGTTPYGGMDYYLNDGTVFKITTNGSFTSLTWFGGSDGIEPEGGLVQGKDGNFYGTTDYGGGYNNGTVFKATPGGTLTTLYSFTGGSDGANPAAALVLGTDGNFYGTTYAGGAYTNQYGQSLGTVFKITTNGTFASLHSFSSSNGANPFAGLVQGADGNLYGTTYAGGAFTNQYGQGLGTVFKIAPTGTLTTLYSFTGGSDGANPLAGLVQGTDGNLYGTTSGGGTNNAGTIFRITLASAPQPVFRSVSLAGGTITLTWGALVGQTYQLQFTTNLNQTNWNDLGNAIIATGSTASATNAIGPDPSRFYRVKVGP
jgi:uncharacterized repeat protein (TIGR03803 family)